MLLLRRALASAILVGLGGLAGCQTAKTVPTRPADVQQAGLHQLWQTPVILATGEKIANVWRVGDSIYISTNQARVVRIDATSGARAWEVDLMNRTYPILRPAEVPGGNSVLIVNRGQAFLVDKTTGQITLQKLLDFVAETDPIVTSHNTFCVGSANYFYALYLDRLGGKRWVNNADKDAYIARPAVVDNGDSIVLATERGIVSRVNSETGDWVWKDHKTDGRVVGGLVADARAAYVPCLDGNVYAFAMANGYRMWNRPLEGRLDKALMLTRSEVLVPTGNTLYALATADGKPRWQADGIRELGTIAGDRVWVLADSGELKALSLETGEVLASAPVGDAMIVANTVDQKTVFLVNRDGTVGAYAAK